VATCLIRSSFTNARIAAGRRGIVLSKWYACHRQTSIINRAGLAASADDHRVTDVDALCARRDQPECDDRRAVARKHATRVSAGAAGPTNSTP
jgi:hypothetical protein